MVKRPTDDPRLAEPAALRLILRRLREIMAETDDGQNRLDKIVRHIAGVMVAEVCSIYLKRQDGSLELFATEGLNRNAVHATFMRRGEGLVGRCAELAIPINESDAQQHPAFSYRPETGEEIYHSFLAVPILRGGDVLGVLTVQNRTRREYSDEDVEALQTTAMVLAEHLVSGAVAGVGTAAALQKVQSLVVRAQPISEGLALGHVVLHEPRIAITDLTASDPVAEKTRLDAALHELKATLDELIDQGDLAREGEHRDVLEAYRMFANDRGWQRRLAESVDAGLTAEAAVEQVQNQSRARMLRQGDPFWRERLRDLDDLSDRLLRILEAQKSGGSTRKELPPDAVLVARTMGAADLLDYDRSRVRGLVIEDGSGQSHVAIVARALGIAAVGQARGLMERVERGAPIIVDAESGEIYLQPTPEVISAYADKARFRARRQSKYLSLKDRPAVTRDGERIALHINAGLQVDVANLDASGADGIGLFRTELQFMIASSFPRLDRQTQAYRAVMAEAGGKPVVFRTLDVGGDKTLSYMPHEDEENPALGWRGIRLALDRPALLRTQIRALMRAAGTSELRMMLPMVSDVTEIAAVKAIVNRETEIAQRRGGQVPSRVHFGIMIEVPALLFALDEIMPQIDFVSIGSNDLMQYLFAADRSNDRVSGRFDSLAPPFLRALRQIAVAAARHDVPVTICGEMAGRPLDAMALIGIGFRSLSMAPANIGPMKAMVLSLDASRIAAHLAPLVDKGGGSLRDELRRFAENEGVEI
ncbi:MAG TPA: phosphoenolpyruvate--protein phosphotransferase [Hyphomicrobiaceae bacterium]|nr:phosphoenolpyruvate--protein phosphotransferase [Hyphomicrobiaceae bacterium]